MLGNAAPTSYDLRFSLLGIPVRVHPLFWLIAAMLGWSSKPELTVNWVGCVFLSVLVHEMGHALVARHYGWPPEIVLYGLGGYAQFSPSWGHSTSRAVKVLIAGPGAGFVLFGLVCGLEQVLISNQLVIDERWLWVYVWIHFMKDINLWWGLINLLPVFPLDGGQISRLLFMHWFPRSGYATALKLSILTAGSFAAFAFHFGQQYTAFMFFILAVESWQALRGEGRF